MLSLRHRSSKPCMWTARLKTACLVLVLCSSLSTLLLAQGTGGRILGRVSDPSGAVLAATKVTLVNQATNVSRDTTTNSNGDYDFVEVPVGNYRVEFDLKGFKKNVRRDVALDINQVITLNMTMQLGAAQEVVDVTSEAPLVETSSTQLGAVVNDRTVSELPLNSRDTYQLLQLQPGVMSTVGSSNSIVYGSNNAGAVSVNGGRGRSNNFSVNGGDANDQFVNLPTVQPSPDSIAEFRVLTNTFDAEYGRNSGSVVNVVTKSGTNSFHGNVYEFFRNTVLNASNYCFSAPCTKPKFNQNQFGGTFGGPIKKDRTFFFASYEGRRIRQGISSPVVTVLSAQELPGPSNVVNGQIVANFNDIAPFAGALTNSYALQPGAAIGQRPGCQAAVTAIGGGAIQDGALYSDIFPNNQIPLACMDPTAVDLLQLVPTATGGGNTVQTSPVQPERGDQATFKFDHRINNSQNFSAYYYLDDHSVVLPFAQFQAAGANVPGFASAIKERFQQYNLTHTWTITNNTVNEFRFNYNREAQRTFQHPQRTSLIQNTCPPPPSWLTQPVPCFYGDGSSDPAGSLYGIHPGLGPQHEGLPFIQINGGFTIGNNGEGELPQVGNSFQWSDSLTKVRGRHTMKFGADVRRQRFDQTLYFNVNGEFFYAGSGVNSVVGANGSNFYPDFLLGMPDSYGQGSAQVENVRSTGVYLFAQDSWKVKPNVTLNYGLRWELNTPIADISKHVQTFRPGQQSTVYPCADTVNTDCSSMNPVGLVVPGDAGVPPGLTQTYYKAFAPRIGIAWSPGSSGKTSIRAGFGMFYNPIEQLVLEQFSAEPPFGVSTFPVGTLFNTPFLGQDGQTAYPNPANGILQAPRNQPVDWGLFRPILLFGAFQPHMRSQYSDQYNLTIERELRNDLKLQVSYVGSQGHRLLATHDLNYGNPQTCLDINALASHNANDVSSYGSPSGCGQFFSDSQFSVTLDPTAASDPVNPISTFHMPDGSTQSLNGQTLDLVGLRRYSSPLCQPTTGVGCPADGIPVFSSIFAQDTIANSAYNSLQASLDKRFAHGLQFTLAYTFSKSFDEASSFEGIVNPIDPARSRSLSNFDARHRLVVSYYWEFPKTALKGAAGKIVNGWALSGVTTLQTGFPIRITSSADNELMYSFDFELPGEPDQLKAFKTLKPQHSCFTDPNSGQANCNYFFDPSTFTEDTTLDPSLFGRIGNARRTICCGPHISNTDFALLKSFIISETKRVDFRAEVFNMFNHTQFFNPDGNSSDGTQFGQVTQARDPRLMQFALKLFF